MVKAAGMTSDERIAHAVHWLEPRIIQVKADLASRDRPGRETVIRLVVPDRIMRLYSPHQPGKPLVSDTIRLLMEKYGVPAPFPAPISGRRRSSVFFFRSGSDRRLVV